MGKDVIIACDFSSKDEVMSFLDRFGEERPFVKIGLELFCSEGPQIVREIKERGHKVFLDLKLHDIPNTVARTMGVLSQLDVDMCNVHAAGGVKMMKEAKDAMTVKTTEAVGSKSAPMLIAVTQLTSTSQEQLEEELMIRSPMEEVVTAYTDCAKKAGLEGVVCSPLEAPEIHDRFGKDFITVTPGVRLEGDDAADQQRTATPAKARELGADYIVVGRSITAASDPVEAYRRCVADFVGDGEQGKIRDERSEAGDRGAVKSTVARALLKTGAVFLRPEDPFTWASGIKSPIYCDNRLILTDTGARNMIEGELASLIKEAYPDAEALFGTATAGIPHAAIAAQMMDLPMGYVRSTAKDHGRANRIEGRLIPGQKVVVIEDLISTGGSCLEAAEALEEAGAEVLGVVSIFAYGLEKSKIAFADAGLEYHSLTDFDAVCDVAACEGYIKATDIEKLMDFRKGGN